MQNIKKMRKKAKKKKDKINLSKIEKKGTITRKKRMRNAIVVVFLLMALLVGRIAWIQFINGDKLCIFINWPHL